MTSGTPLLTAERLTKQYRNVTALNQVSFTISDGITGILGENGAGAPFLPDTALVGISRS